MTDPIRQKIEVDAQQAKRELQDVSRAEKKVAADTKDMGDAARRTTRDNDMFGSSIEGAARQLKALAAGMLGSQGIIAIYETFASAARAVNREMGENLRLTKEQAQARLDLAALSGFESEADMAMIDQFAVQSGRGPADVARLLTQIKSAMPNASVQQQAEVLRRTAMMASISESGMPRLADPLLTLQDQTGDARIASNILMAAIEQAREPDPGRLGPYITRFGLTGMSVGGLSPGESAGLLSATTKFMTPEVASTTLDAAVRAIRGNTSPEARAILEREGVDTSDTLTAFRQIGAAVEAGRISRAEIQIIGGEQGMRLFGGLANASARQDYFARVAAVAAAERSEEDLLAQKVQGVLGSSRIQSLNLLSKQQQSRLEVMRGRDTAALSADAARNELEIALRERAGNDPETWTPARIENALQVYDTMVYEGYDPVRAAALAPNYAFGLTYLGMSHTPWLFRRILHTGGDLPGGGGEAGDVDPEIESRVQSRLDEGAQVNVTNITNQYNNTTPPGQADSGRAEE